MGYFDWMPDQLVWLCIPRCDTFRDFLALRLISKRFNEVLTSDSYWKTFSDDSYHYLFFLLRGYWIGLKYLNLRPLRGALVCLLSPKYLRDKINQIPFQIRHIYNQRRDFDFRTVVRIIMFSNYVSLDTNLTALKRRRAKYLRVGFHKCNDPASLVFKISLLQRKVEECLYFANAI